ncbi:NACHT C-terminal helical domain 2-containing protein [Nostoc sp.]
MVDCLNSDCYVSKEVRQQIEDTLLYRSQRLNSASSNLKYPYNR